MSGPEDEMKIEYRPIGFIHSPFKERRGMPIQPTRGRGVRGTVEIIPKYADGLADLDGFSHVVLIYHFHRSRGFDLRVTPFLDTKKRGLFAPRAPRRPNPIGLSVVRLIGIEDSRLLIEDLDILDGTPLLDIKPYVPEFDHRTEVREGWLEGVKDRHVVADDRFSDR
jgi:tRNA-Thr(GGU) m(6)t(6)A37 methyltransferase TsaA